MDNFYNTIEHLIKKVDASRKGRLNKQYPGLNVSESEQLVYKYHPDYIHDKKRELILGPNKGERIANEIADIIETRSFVDPSILDLNNIQHDVDALVIGSGGAALSAAIEAHLAGAKVLLATKLRLGDANTVMAEGGIQAADKETDSPTQHYLDAIGGGHFTNDPKLVKTLTENAPLIIAWLEKLGVMFDKDAEGNMITVHGGGTSRKRLHSAKDYTGLEILRVVRDKFLNLQIPFFEFCSATELLKDSSGKIAGAVLYNMETKVHELCRAKTVILATGGIGRLHLQGYPCTNHYGATGDGLVMGYRAGVPFVFMKSIQYHPTGVAYPDQIAGLLVTEKVRGLGGQLLNVDGERFISELLPRDVVASGVIREVKERNKGITTPTGRQGVWLDSPMIDMLYGKGTVQHLLPAMYDQYEKYGIEMDKVPILIYPTQHYQNGGLKINSNAQTTIENLYAAGEVSGGIHGENRLMGNSLLDILVFGRIAGKHAAETSKKIKLGKLTLDHISEYNKNIENLKIPTERLKSPILLPDYGPGKNQF